MSMHKESNVSSAGLKKVPHSNFVFYETLVFNSLSLRIEHGGGKQTLIKC